MALASRLRMLGVGPLATIAFYGIAGIVFLVLLPFSGFPPHVALLGIVSVVAAYGLFMNRKWANWLVAVLFFVATTFSLYTLYFVVVTDAVATAGMVVYVVLTWIFTIYIFRTHRSREV